MKQGPDTFAASRFDHVGSPASLPPDKGGAFGIELHQGIACTWCLARFAGLRRITGTCIQNEGIANGLWWLPGPRPDVRLAWHFGRKALCFYCTSGHLDSRRAPAIKCVHLHTVSSLGTVGPEPRSCAAPAGPNCRGSAAAKFLKFAVELAAIFETKIGGRKQSKRR